MLLEPPLDRVCSIQMACLVLDSDLKIFQCVMAQLVSVMAQCKC